MTVPATTHLPSPVSTRSGVVAHRGASAEFPELTQVAYQQALEQGAEALEVDVRLTSDGVPVLLHDPRTTRVADRDLWVHASTLEQISALLRIRWWDWPLADIGAATPMLMSDDAQAFIDAAEAGTIGPRRG